MNRVLILAILSMFSVDVFAEDIYYAQSQAGGNTGADCDNAKAISALTWGAGAGNIGAGDTAHLCGTIGTAISVGASGSAGNPITIKFETDAKLSDDVWSSGANILLISGRTFITVDGGSNGIIEATANGTGLTAQYNLNGVKVTGTVSDITIKNLTIQNLYVRTAYSSDSGFTGSGINMDAMTGSNFLVDNVVISKVETAFWLTNAKVDNVTVSNNDFSHMEGGFWVGNNGAALYVTNLSFYGNTINTYDDGGDSSCSNAFAHGDGIHTWSYSGSNHDNIYIYNNTFGPAMGACLQTTAWLYIEGQSTNTLVYNNKFLARDATQLSLITLADGVNASRTCGGAGGPCNGLIYLKCDGPGAPFTCDYGVYNNTFATGDGNSYGSTGLNVGAVNGSATVDVKNNIFTDGQAGLWIQDMTVTNDYNLFYGNTSWDVRDGVAGANTVTADPLFDSNFTLQAGSPAIDNGADLSAYFTTDYAGNTRSGTWDIGAYEFGASDSTPDAFSFTDQTDVALGSTNNSDNVTTAGFDNTTTLALTGDASCKYSINGAAWATANDNITVGDNVALQNVASGAYSTAVSCTLNLGGVSDTWNVTTLAAVSDPQTPRFRGSSMSGGWR